MFATGQVLDFGGGIGTHSIAAAASSSVEHVFFVDLNPHNRNFVKQRANQLGLSERLSVHRDIESTGSAFRIENPYNRIKDNIYMKKIFPILLEQLLAQICLRVNS